MSEVTDIGRLENIPGMRPIWDAPIELHAAMYVDFRPLRWPVCLPTWLQQEEVPALGWREWEVYERKAESQGRGGDRLVGDRSLAKLARLKKDEETEDHAWREM